MNSSGVIIRSGGSLGRAGSVRLLFQQHPRSERYQCRGCRRLDAHRGCVTVRAGFPPASRRDVGLQPENRTRPNERRKVRRLWETSLFSNACNTVFGLRRPKRSDVVDGVIVTDRRAGGRGSGHPLLPCNGRGTGPLRHPSRRARQRQLRKPAVRQKERFARAASVRMTRPAHTGQSTARRVPRRRGESCRWAERSAIQVDGTGSIVRGRGG